MKKTTLYLSFLLCFVAISVLTSCGGGSGDENAQSRETNKSISKKVGTSGGEVKLEDTSTSISLDIPGDALSEEANITITHLKGAAVHDSLKEFSNREGGVVFEFGPDGLVFDKPVPFTVKLGEIDGSTQLGQMQLPVVAAISVTSDGTVSSLSDLELVYDGETDGVSLTGTLSHFSKIEIRIIKNLLVTAEGVPETPIAPGTHFNVNVKLPGKDKLKNSDKVSTYYFDESEPQVLYHSVAPNDQFEWNNFDYSCQTDEGIYSAVVTMRLQEGEPFWQVKDGNSHFNIEREFVGEPKIRFEKRVSCPPDLPKVAINVLSDPPIKESDSAVIELVADQAYDEPLQFDVSAFGSAKYGLDWHFGGSDVNLFVEKLDKEFSFDDSDGNYYDTEKAFIYDPMRGGVIDTETGEVVQYKEPLNHTFRFKLGAGQTKLTLGLHGIDNFVLDGDKVLGLFISSVQAALSSSPLNSFLWPDDLGDGSGTAVLGARGTLLTVVPNEVSGVINEPFQIALEQTFSAFGDGTSTASSNVILYIEDPNGVLSAPSLDAPREGDGASASLNNTNRQLFESQVSYLSLDSAARPSTNKQRLNFSCLKAGGAIVKLTALINVMGETMKSPMGRLSVPVECKDSEPPLYIGEFAVLKPESFGGYFGPSLKSNNKPEGEPFAEPKPRNVAPDFLDLPLEKDYALVASEAGIKIYDLANGQEETRLGWTFGPLKGGIVLNAPDSSNDRSEWMFSYGSSGGVAKTRYNGETWGGGVFSPGASKYITDIVVGPVDANGRDTDFAVVDKGSDTVRYWKWYGGEVNDWSVISQSIYKRSNGEWDKTDDQAKAISVAGGFNNTPALVLVHKGVGVAGELWSFYPTQDHNDNQDSKIGNVGISPEKMRCLLTICVVSNFGDNTVTTVKWNGPTVGPVIVDTEAVGDSPSGIDLIKHPSGSGVMAVVAGWGSGDYTILEIDNDANITSKSTVSLSNCSNMGFAHFTDGEGTHIMATCTESNKVLIVPRN